MSRWFPVATLFALATLVVGLVPDAGAITLTGVNAGIVVNTEQELPWSGVGLALVDVDGDGLFDVVTSGGGNRPPELWHNDGLLMFSLVPPADSGLPEPGVKNTDLRGVAAADYDNDGDTDLFVANYHPNGSSLLLRNDGGKFVDVTAGAGIAIDGRATTGAWGDFDGDGWLDLHVSRYFLDRENLLLRNMGDGTFVDVAVAAGITSPPEGGIAYSYHSLWFDIDRDGDSDLYVANDRCYGGNPRNRLWINDGDGTFHEDAEAHGLATCYDGMGLALGDLDNDGFPEIFMTNVAYGHLLLSSECGKFSDITSSTGTVSYQWGWGALFADLDHNMWPDLYLAHQSVSTGDPTDRLFMNEEGQLTEVSATALDIDHGESFVVVRADLDLDGDQDLVVSRVGLGDTTRVLRNDGPTGHYLRVRLEGTITNRDGLGAVVEVFAGGRWQRQERHEAAAYGGRGDPALHFGLAEHVVADQVRVHWPSGALQVFVDVDANQLLHVVEPADGAPGSSVPYPERCGDLIDNDCDNGIDEGFDVGASCVVTSGDCELEGVVVCSPDLEHSECDLPPFAPPQEICGNGVDDDCDALTDEGYPVGEPCQAGTGACLETGTWECAPGGFGVICSTTGAEPAAELCGNAVDDDCNGETDEGFDIGDSCTLGVGACAATGARVCSSDGAATSCDAIVQESHDERCGNAVDDDCDGETDEGFDIGLSCHAGVGGCERPGLTRCLPDGSAVFCDAPVGAAAAERCGNLLDDDCDGETDEGFDVGGACEITVGGCILTGVSLCAVSGYHSVCAPAGDGSQGHCDLDAGGGPEADVMGDADAGGGAGPAEVPGDPAPPVQASSGCAAGTSPGSALGLLALALLALLFTVRPSPCRPRR